MRIHYYSPHADSTVNQGFVNFGDDLNATIWDQLIPGMLDNDDSVVFSGIGSHLNSGFAKRFAGRKHVVFGTGYGYGEPIGNIDEKWTIHFVRGPLTAKSMGLPLSYALTDAAMAIRLLPIATARRDIPVSVMPHIASMEGACESWKLICDDLGFRLIDVRSPQEVVLDELGRSEVLLTEALHGAIVADALRTPWVPFTSNPTISSLKWRDWCASIDLQYAPVPLMPIWPHTGRFQFIGTFKRAVKLALIKRRLATMARKGKRQLSTESTIDELTERMASAVESLREKFAQCNHEVVRS